MIRLLLLLAAQTQALRAPPTRPLRIRHVHRAVTAPPTDAATNRVALTFPVLTVAAAALGRAAPRSVAATVSGAARPNAAAATVSTGKVKATRFVAASVVGAVTARRTCLIRSGRVGGVRSACVCAARSRRRRSIVLPETLLQPGQSRLVVRDGQRQRPARTFVCSV